tara:strand:+ start:750 stop:953 length:204 start_codon:yes stop_codon:yes gene_type:complete
MAQMVKDKEVNPLVLQKKYDKFQNLIAEPTQVSEMNGPLDGFETYKNEHTYGGKMSPIRYNLQIAQI